jgi:hypothetical protein
MFQVVVCAVQFVTESHTTLHTIYTTAWNIFYHKTAEQITMYFYWLNPQNCNFSKAKHKFTEDGPDRPKYVGANMRYFNLHFNILYV